MGSTKFGREKLIGWMNNNTGENSIAVDVASQEIDKSKYEKERKNLGLELERIIRKYVNALIIEEIANNEKEDIIINKIKQGVLNDLNISQEFKEKWIEDHKKFFLAWINNWKQKDKSKKNGLGDDEGER